MRKSLVFSHCVVMAAVLSGGFPQLSYAADPTIQVTSDARKESVLTVYSDNFAQIQDTYDVKFHRGNQSVVLTGLPLGVDTDSLSIDGKGIQLHSMSVRRPPQSGADYLQSMVGKTVKAVRMHPKSGRDLEKDAVLVAVSPRPVLKIDGKLELDYPGRVVLPADSVATVADGITLAAWLSSEYASEENMRVHYKVPGLSWQANYRAVYNADAGTLDLQGRVAVENHTRTDFNDVRLRVVAGRVNQVFNGAPMPRRSAAKLMSAPRGEAVMNAQVPVQESGYLLYPVASDVSIQAGEMKDVTILETGSLPVNAVYEVRDPVHVGFAMRNKTVLRGASLRLDLSTAEKSPALPAGVMHVMTPQDGDADMLIGELRIPHVPPGGDLHLRLGQAVDIASSATMTEQRRISDETVEYGYKVLLSNTSPHPVTMEVIQSFPAEWRVTKESLSHTKVSAKMAKWSVVVPAKQETPLTFTVRITRKKS